MNERGRAWIELNLDHLLHNVKQIRNLIPANCAVMPAVKANAYGHGAVLIGRALQEAGINDFCVACADEAIELREAGITGQILILGYTSPYQFPDLVSYSLTQTALDISYARLLNDYGQPINVHIGIDTGMHRLGERSDNIEAICDIWRLTNLKIAGVFSHLCVSDGHSKVEKTFTLEQIKQFNQLVKALHQRGLDGFKTHIQGSYGVLNYPFLRYDYVRPGIALYGILSSEGDKVAANVDLRPVLSLKSRITSIRTLYPGESAGYGLTYTAAEERKTAAVSIGYADGIPRELSNWGYALVNGHEAPIAGRICMDQLMLDISNIPNVSPGDEAVFIGCSGRREITAAAFADRANTISNEVLSRLGSRLKRICTD